MAYKWKIFEAVSLILHGYQYFVCIHMCTISKDIGINKETICLLNILPECNYITIM